MVSLPLLEQLIIDMIDEDEALALASSAEIHWHLSEKARMEQSNQQSSESYYKTCLKLNQLGTELRIHVRSIREKRKDEFKGTST